jgi:hypothetical protein
MYNLQKTISFFILLTLMTACQTTTQIAGCQNSVVLGYGVFQVSDLSCTYDSDFTRGTSKATSTARNNKYNTSNVVSSIIHPNMYYNLKPIKDYDFKAGFYYIKLKNHCFEGRVSNDQVVTYYNVCKNNFEPFTNDEVKRMIEKRYEFASHNSSFQKSSSDSLNINYENCKKLGFSEGTANFKKCLSNLSK